MVALWAIVALGTITTGVMVATRSTTTAAANYRARVVARYAAESGVTVAVATLESNLAALTADARRQYLNQLDLALGGNEQVALDDARFAVALVDVGSRLDVNRADASSLTTLFSYFTDAIEAANVADAIRAYVAGDRSQAGQTPLPVRGLVGATGLAAARPLRSIDELARVPGVRTQLARRAAPYLTVDGDGTISRATASDTVLAAARGELRDEPSRILVISRGWLDGQPLTHEIQAVYAVVGGQLTLVQWRERDL